MPKNKQYTGKSLADLKKILEKRFNKYIRLRDSDASGHAECISCGKTVEYGTSDCQAGHYIPKTRAHLRFNEHNVNVQCKRCNSFMSGNIHNYRLGMEEKYGVDEERHIWGQRNLLKTFLRHELIEMINRYKIFVDELKIIKGLD